MRARRALGPGGRLVVLGVLTAAAVLFYFRLLRDLPFVPNPDQPPRERISRTEECPCPRDLGEVNVKDVALEMETNEDAVIGFFHQKRLSAQRGVGALRHPLDAVFETLLFQYPPLRHSVCLPDHRRSKAVPCLPYPSVPGYAKACNFTAANSGLPWFCGHPVTKGLNCSHRSQFKELSYLQPLPLPEPLRQYVDDLTRCCPLKETPDLRLIANDVTLVTSPSDQADDKQPKEAAQFPGPLPPCSSRPVSESWAPPSHSPSPRGWLRHGQWYPSTCTLPHVTKDRVLRCMRNRTLLLLGDSNQRALWYYVQNMTGCTKRNQTEWNAPMICKNDTLRSSAVFATHAFPFMPAHPKGLPLANLPLPQALNFIEQQGYQGNGDVTAVIHYYMHLSPHSVQVYRSFVQDARRTVREYLKLHPKAKFLIRGPHVLYQGHEHHVHIGDKFAGWYQRIWREEFAELSDRVWYLDTWDLTIASENEDMHAIPVIPEILKILFGYMCNAE